MSSSKITKMGINLPNIFGRKTEMQQQGYKSAGFKSLEEETKKNITPFFYFTGP